MLALFSALMIVYLLLYEIKGAQIAKELSSGIATWTLSDQNVVSQESKNLYADEQQSELEDTQTPSSSWMVMSTTTQSLFSSLNSWTNKNTTGTKVTINTMKVLSWTSLYYGTVESAEKLGLNYQYALKDQKGILYVYLGTGKYDIETTTRQLGGSIYKMTTEQEITQNKLFWDTVIYINLPEYKDKKVVMMLTINKAVWLLQVDYATYHTSKWYIKKTFTE